MVFHQVEQAGAADHPGRESAVVKDAYHMGAHQQQLQQVCDKWGGSHEEMHAFARDSAFGAPRGSPLGQLVAIAHIEEWFSLDSARTPRTWAGPR